MGLEQFIGFDQGEGMSEAAFEAFKERMAAAAAQIAAIKKEETKQKKKEEELLKILLKFVKNSSKKELVLLLSRALEQNLPANFILAIILLGNEEIKREVGGTFLNASTKALIFFKASDESMPLKVKIELDHWLKNLLFQAEENPQKLLKNAYDIEMIELEREYSFEDPKYEERRHIKKILIQLITYILKDFLAENKMDEPYDKLYEFAGFVIKGILDKAQENIDGRKLLN